MARIRVADFEIVDADSHVYEPEDIWDRYVPDDERALARSAFWHSLDLDGNRLTILNGEQTKEMNRSKLVRQAIWKPGRTAEQIGSLDPRVFEPLTPGASDPEQRLADMDAMDVQRAIVFPTLFLEYFPLVRDPSAAAVLARAYNDWILDFCSADPDRLQPAAILPLQSVLLARRELDRVAERGFRIITMRPMWYPVVSEGGASAGGLPQAGGFGAPVWDPAGPYLLSPHFRPLWEQIADLDVVVAAHPSPGSTNPEGMGEGSFIERVSARMGIGHSVAETTAYDQDLGLFLFALAFQGTMEDFPRLRLALAHSSIANVPVYLEKAETYLWLGTFAGGDIGVGISLEPDHVFDEHPVVVTFPGWEGAAGRLAEVVSGYAAWGSRYPHHDAGDAREAIENLKRNGASEDQMARMMGANAIELFGLGALSVSSSRPASTRSR